MRCGGDHAVGGGVHAGVFGVEAAMSAYQTYPKSRRGMSRPVRMGRVEANDDTQELAGYVAAVTHEEDGWVRFYIYTETPAEALFPRTPLWIGPYQGLSEEIVDL
jgi:hypothetical protein